MRPFLLDAVALTKGRKPEETDRLRNATLTAALGRLLTLF